MKKIRQSLSIETTGLTLAIVIGNRPLAKIFYGIIRGYFLLIFSFSDGQNI